MLFSTTPEMETVISELARERNESPEETVRTAIALLKTVEKGKTEGYQPALIDNDGKPVAILTEA